MRKSKNLFFKYLFLLVKSSFQYRANVVFLSLGVFVREFVNVLIMYFILQRFQNINGWTLYEMLFLYSIIFLTYSLLVGFFAGVRNFPRQIQGGNLDTFLTKPMGILFQVICSGADYFAAIGHGIIGFLLFFFSASKIGLVWNLINILYYITAILGGVLIQLSVWLLMAAISIRTIKSDEFLGFLFWNARKFAGYPLSIFPAIIKFLLMFVIPFAFVNFFPAQYYLQKPDLDQFWRGFLYFPLPVGSLVFFFVLLFWKKSLESYTSTGT